MVVSTVSRSSVELTAWLTSSSARSSLMECDSWVISLHEPTTSIGWPFLSRTNCCADPTITAILLQKSILGRVPAVLEQLARLSFHRGDLIRVHATPPEIGALQVLVGLVTEPVLDVLTDEGRREISRRPVAVDHGRRAHE